MQMASHPHRSAAIPICEAALPLSRGVPAGRSTAHQRSAAELNAQPSRARLIARASDNKDVNNSLSRNSSGKIRYTRIPRVKGVQVRELRVEDIRRPLAKTRSNDQDKVKWLMESIAEIGLLEPIDVLEVDGVYYGFSGCHRFEAHQRLGYEYIKCNVRKANKGTLKMHMV